MTPLINKQNPVFEIIYIINIKSLKLVYSFSVCPKVKCNGNTTTTLASSSSHCRCDPLCSTFGDCCADAPNATSSLPDPLITCVSVPTNLSSDLNIYMKRSCKIKDKNFQKCLKSSYNNTDPINEKNIKTKVPVTNTETNMTYGNLFCARCNNDSTYQIWNVSVTCQSVNETLYITRNSSNPKSFFGDRPELRGKLKFNSTIQQWQMFVNNRTENCTLRPTPPQSVMSHLRPCISKIVSNCSSSGNTSDVAKNCSSHMSVVTDIKGITYRNEECATCNNVHSQDLTCSLFPPVKIPGGRRIPFSPLFLRFPFSPRIIPEYKYPLKINITTNTNTTTNEVTSVSTGSDTSTTNTIQTTTSNSIPIKPVDKRRAYMYLQVQMDCITALKSINFTKISADTKYYPSMNRSYIKNKTFIIGSTIDLCRVSNVTRYDIVNPKGVSSFSNAVVIFGLIITVIFLLIYLAKFFSPQAIITINQRAIASYAFALLLGNIGLLSKKLSKTKKFCLIMSFSTYYGFLSSFFWLSSMAFDLICVVWTIAYDFQKTNTFSDSTRLPVYSILSWGLPVLITMLLVYIEKDASQTIMQTCILQKNQTFLLFFILPLTCSMSVNLAFYLCSAYVVYTEPTVGNKLSLVHGINFKLHTSLIVITNVMCTTLLLENSYAWILFTILDVILSILVYLCSPLQTKSNESIKHVSFTDEKK